MLMIDVDKKDVSKKMRDERKVNMAVNLGNKAKVAIGMRWCWFFLLALAVLSLSALVQAQGVVRSGELRITAQDERQILKEAGIRRVGSHYVAAGCDDHLQVELIAVDLNGDKQAEVILKVTGSPCFSGMMQSNVGVYVRSKQGRWRDTLGFLPAFGVRIQAAKTKGYADLVLTVLGGCDPVYRWTGGSYYYAEQLPAYGKKCNANRP